MSEVLLDVQGLSISLGKEEVVRASSFCVMKRGITALAGESGAGKSLTASALIGLLPERARTSGHALYHGRDLLTLSERQWQDLRGRKISLVFQNPLETLNPSYRAGTQLKRVLRMHGLYKGRAQLEELFRSVGLLGSERKYPHELSGGMRQRLSLLLALSLEPELLIADEVTSSLDREQEELILRLLTEKQKAQGFSLLLITHDLRLAERYADRIAVMKDGEVVEEGPASLLSSPSHPHTRALVRDSKLFPPLPPAAAGAPVLEARDLTKTFGKEKVLDGLSFTLHKGERLGIKGPSGIGKTTLLNILSRLTCPDSGSLLLNGEDFLGLEGQELRWKRQKLQLIFQDPGASLDGKKDIKTIVLEGARLSGKRDLDKLYSSVMGLVSLSPLLASRHPDSLSGGEQARVAIARALAMGAEILVLDEITSALDASLRKGILDLLASLPVSIVFASHDISALGYLCSRVLALEDGKLKESP